MRAFDAVLFDWSGTLVHDPHPTERLAGALHAAGRSLDVVERDALLTELSRAATDDEVVAMMIGEDTSAERHRVANMLWFERAGLDTELAEALYAFDADPDNRPLYPDAIATLTALKALGVKVAVVSDIHLDIRLLLDGQGLGEFVDTYVLSFEHGCQKPDPRMFVTALTLLDVPAERALMVGDRASHDGGAAEVGIATYILPPAPLVNAVRGLDAVTRMVG